MVKLRAVAPVVAIAAVLGTGCAINLNAEQYLGKEDKTFAVTGKPEISLKTFDGSIEVKTWDKPEVALTIERRAGTQAEAEALKVTTSQDGNRIVVEALQPEKKVEVGVGFNVGRSVRFVVTVPVTTDLTARTGDGAIAVTGVHGRLDLRSGDGSVTGTGLDGEVAAHTGDGSNLARGCEGHRRCQHRRRQRPRGRVALGAEGAHRRWVGRSGHRQRDGGQGRLGDHDRRRQRQSGAAGRVERERRCEHRRRQDQRR